MAPPFNWACEFKKELFVIFMFKGFVTESIPPFSVDLEWEKIDESINISPRLSISLESEIELWFIFYYSSL